MELIVALLMIINGEIKEHRIQESMSDCLKGKSISKDYSVMDQWYQLQKDKWLDSEDCQVVNTMEILKAFVRKCRKDDIYFESFQQNDSADFIRVFMDMLHDSIKRKVKVTVKGEPQNRYDELKVEGIKSWTKFFENSYSFIISSVGINLNEMRVLVYTRILASFEKTGIQNNLQSP